MTDHRIKTHPILNSDRIADLPFTWQGQLFYAKENEMISSALMANGITVFRYHPKDDSPQGLFCANGQCSQCMVMADGQAVKACMTPVRAHMQIFPARGLPKLPLLSEPTSTPQAIPVKKTQVLIIGGGPAGLSAALELGEAGVGVLLVDDKTNLGGKLVLQTHRFFGSREAVYAGSRGIEIAQKLEKELHACPSVEVWMNSTAIAVFEEKTVGVYRNQEDYLLVQPEVLLVTTGAREKSLIFPGNTLPGVYGAGAFQTLVNRDLVQPCKNLFVVGGGNVGLIASYHAIQAGIHVAGLVEAAPRCGGYKVHLDKLVRSGVPVFTSHTVLRAIGKDAIESVILCAVDENFKAIPGTEKILACDTLLIAVGLDPVNELYKKAREVGMNVFTAGDAREIAEASAAIFSGKIVGQEIASQFSKSLKTLPKEWLRTEEILKSRPGQTHPFPQTWKREGVYPVIHCTQEIPCNPCASICPKSLIHVDTNDIRNLPQFLNEGAQFCIACGRCVAVCPGLAITLTDYRQKEGFAEVTLPWEQDPSILQTGSLLEAMDTDGKSLGHFPIIKIRKLNAFSGTTLVTLESPADIAPYIAGLRVIPSSETQLLDSPPDLTDDDAYLCRCERVRVGDVRTLIREGVRDINQIKAATKVSMGACGGKTCLSLIRQLFRSEGVPPEEIVDCTIRPVFIEMPLHVLANLPSGKDQK